MRLGVPVVTVLRLSHIGICVSDISKSIDFYCNVFGFKQLSNVDVKGAEAEKIMQIPGVNLTAAYLERDGTRIELLYYREPGCSQSDRPKALNETGLTHLSFRVTDLEMVASDVEKYGGSYLGETRVDVDNFNVKSAFVADPDGLKIELLQLPTAPDWLPGM